MSVSGVGDQSPFLTFSLCFSVSRLSFKKSFISLRWGRQGFSYEIIDRWKQKKKKREKEDRRRKKRKEKKKKEKEEEERKRRRKEKKKKQVRIHESTVACDWAGAVMPENHEKK